MRCCNEGIREFTSGADFGVLRIRSCVCDHKYTPCGEEKHRTTVMVTSNYESSGSVCLVLVQTGSHVDRQAVVQAQQQDSCSALPDEVLLHIFSFLDVSDLDRVAGVCKRYLAATSGARNSG